MERFLEINGKFLLIFFSLAVSISLHAGERWEFYGDQFFKNGEYYRAITMYYMAFFDAVSDRDRCRLLTKSAESFIRAGYYEEALREYDRGKSYCSEERLIYLRGRLFFIRGNYSMAEYLWGRLRDRRRNFLVGISKMMQFDRDGLKFLRSYADEVSGEDKKKVFSLMKNFPEKLPYRSPLLAGVLSALLPGAGQVYTSHYGEAGMSFVVNAIFAFLTYQAIRKAEMIPHYGYAEAGFWGFIGMGFYLGNIYGAVLSAKRYNYYYRSRFRREMLNQLQISYSFP